MSLSVSPFAKLMFEKVNAKFVSGDATATNEKELQTIFKSFGATEVFARMGTMKNRYEPYIDYSFESMLEKAVIAKDLDLPLNPEINLCPDHADVRGQNGPDLSEFPEIELSKQWHELTIDEMCKAAAQFGEIVAREIFSAGARVNVWNIGNEVNLGYGGVAIKPFPNAFHKEYGPDWYKTPYAVNPELGQMSSAEFLSKSTNEQIKWAKTNLWPYQFRLMKAVTDGISSVDESARFSTHTTWAANTEFTLAFTKSLLESGFPLSSTGLAFYPSASPNAKANYERTKETIAALNSELGLSVFIAEYAYPASTPTGVYSNWSHEVEGYGFTAEGQAGFLKDFLDWGASNGICGVRPWAPDLCALGWEAFALFEADGSVMNPRLALSELAVRR